MALTRFGYTLSVESPAQGRDLEQYRQVREDARRPGMSLIAWARPRGKAYRHEFCARDIWPREPGESLRFAAQLKDILAKLPLRLMPSWTARSKHGHT